MQLGALSFPRTAVLAPMAGVGDRAFREVCRSFGAAFTIGEICLLYTSSASYSLPKPKQPEAVITGFLNGTPAMETCKIARENGDPTYKHVCKDGPVFEAKEVIF